MNVKTQAQLFDQFGDESHILLADVLKKEISEILEKGLREIDERDGFTFWKTQGDWGKIADHQTGVEKLPEDGSEWKIIGPPHRQRYLTLESGESANAKEVNQGNPKLPTSLPGSSNEILNLLKDSLFPSPAFRNWLSNLTQLVPMSRRDSEVRRFRPGLDYTLARSDEEVVLDVTLGLTPKVWESGSEEKKKGPKGLSGKNKKATSKAKNGEEKTSLSKKQKKELEDKWENGEIGGWECYMAPHEGEEDPAVYQAAGGSKKPQPQPEVEETNGDQEMKDGEAEEEEEEEDDEDEEEDDEDFDGVLLNLTPDFNVLNIALRDEGVMRFVKYLSSQAGGSRWDVNGEFICGAVEEESEDE